MTDQSEQKAPSLNDVGTRHQHLQDHLEALECVRDRMMERGQGRLSYLEKQKLLEIAIAANVLQKTIDAFLGIGTDTSTEYQLYKLLNSVPKKADDIPNERGTPLI